MTDPSPDAQVVDLQARRAVAGIADRTRALTDVVTTQVLPALDELGTRIDGVERRIDGVDRRVDGLRGEVRDLARMVVDIDERTARLEGRMDHQDAVLAEILRRLPPPPA